MVPRNLAGNWSGVRRAPLYEFATEREVAEFLGSGGLASDRLG
jgi:hypothetical protein